MGLVAKTRRLVQADRRFEAAVGLQEQACTGSRVKALDGRMHQSPSEAQPLVALGHGHFGELVAALSLVLQGDSPNNLVINHGEQNMAAVINHLALRI